MAVNNITQTISTIPTAGHRGVDVQTVFVNKQEAFQDALTGTFVVQINTLKTQLNTFAGEINSTASQVNTNATTSTTQAGIATTKASEASTSASQALTSRNQAETFKDNASASATKSSQWADNNYNVPVEIDKYSAKHWATVAQNTVNNKVDKVTSTDNAIVRFNGTTGTLQNSNVFINDNGNLNLSGVGARITGDFSNGSWTNRLSIQNSASNTVTSVHVLPNGTATATSLRVFNSSNPDNSSFNELTCTEIDSKIVSGTRGTGTYLPISFYTGGSERMRIDTSGNVLLTSGTGALGYGAGAGGTVTQLTSKSTAVTLNKPTGRIIMHSEALAAGATVVFLFGNNLLSLNDNIVISLETTNLTNMAAYNIWTNITNSGSCYINIKNISAESLSQSIVINFTVFKGAVS